MQDLVSILSYFLFLFFIFLLFVFSRAAPLAYGGSQARGLIGAAAVSLHHSHSNLGRGLDLASLRLWCRPAAIAPIKSLAWESPYAAGAAL